MDECNEVGTILTVWAPPAQRLKGGPVRCCDVWDTRCPTCTSGSDRPCFMGCKCSCDGCAVGRVWYAPDRDELFPEDQWYNMQEEAQEGQEGSEGQEGQEGQEEETRAEREIREDLLQRAEDMVQQERNREHRGQDGGVQWQDDSGQLRWLGGLW